MSKEKPLWFKMGFDKLYIALARRIGWLGFPARELAGKVCDLVQEHGAKRIATALFEFVSWEGNRIMIAAKAKKSCRVILGPQPHEQVEVYQNCDPEFRPVDWDKPPEIPKGGPDPEMEKLYRLVPLDLPPRLQLARKLARLHPDEPSEVGAVESELIRRGMEIPPEEPAKVKPEAKPKTKRTKKGA